MKASTTFFITFFIALFFGNTYAQDGELPGDANCDGFVNVLDIIAIANYFAENEADPFCFENADVNGDGAINVMDIILTIEIFLNDDPGYGTVTDIDGNVYLTLILGNQEWMVGNLRVAKFNNGDSIPTGLNLMDWSNATSGAYAIYPHDIIPGLNSDEAVLDAYGAIYNGYVIDDPRGLCPAGWHVPSHDEWTQLEQFICNTLGNSNCDTQFPYDHTTTGNRGTNEGNALKSCRQVDSPLEGCATSDHPRWSYQSTHYGFDEFGFSALPGGYRSANGYYYRIGRYAHWWSSTPHSSIRNWCRTILDNSGSVNRSYYVKRFGLSVRCVRNVAR